MYVSIRIYKNLLREIGSCWPAALTTKRRCFYCYCNILLCYANAINYEPCSARLQYYDYDLY